MATIYTLWKGKKNEEDDALLLESEPFFKIKRNAFKRAHKLVNQLPIGWDYVILVRKIKLGEDTCLEWVFEREDKD